MCFLLCTITYYYHFVKTLAVFLQGDLSSGQYGLWQIADIRDDNLLSFLHIDFISTVDVGDRTSLGARHHNGCADDGFAVFIDHATRNGLVLGHDWCGSKSHHRTQTYSCNKLSHTVFSYIFWSLMD